MIKLATLATGTAAPVPGSIFGMPEQGSTIAADVDWIYDFITWVCIFFFVLIVGFMVYFVIKYRRKDHVASAVGATHNTPLEVTWTVIPLMIVMLMFYWGLDHYMAMATPPADSYVVDVEATQWSWSFTYPTGEEDSELHTWVNQPVKLRMRSQDVIHSLWVPAFRIKMDLIPGRYTTTWFTATGTGSYRIYCAEYCGTQHSQMVGTVIVYNQFAFEAKIEELADWLDKVPEENLHKAGVVLYNRCTSCHTVDGSPLIGPSFQETHELFKSGGTRKLSKGSAVTVNEDYLRSSIRKPSDQIAANAQGVAYPSSMTPTIADQLGTRGVEAMIQMIMRLDELVDEDGKLIEVKRADIVVEAEEPQ